jgi:hypothetical protein
MSTGKYVHHYITPSSIIDAVYVPARTYRKQLLAIDGNERYHTSTI